MTSPVRAALIYDFDGTLAPGNIQEHSLLPSYLGTSPQTFWDEVAREKQAHDADEILVYLRLLLEHARRRGLSITRSVLTEHGAKTPFFDGVTSWFERIDAYARERGLELEHYVVSSGNEEMIRGSKIGRHFRTVFASRYRYDENGNAIWPAVAVNYTTKTQYLFRINKGVDNSWNNEPVNRWIPMAERPMPFERMIYLGDGDTDIPSMKMVRHQGGHSIAVFDPQKWDAPDPERRESFKQKAYNLIAEDRAHFVVPADYRDGSQLDITVKGILGRVCRDSGWRGQTR
jgi:phosphoserine phosphatase